MLSALEHGGREIINLGIYHLLRHLDIYLDVGGIPYIIKTYGLVWTSRQLVVQSADIDIGSGESVQQQL